MVGIEEGRDVERNSFRSFTLRAEADSLPSNDEAHGMRPAAHSSEADDSYTDFADYHRFRGAKGERSREVAATAGFESVKICAICVPLMVLRQWIALGVRLSESGTLRKGSRRQRGVSFFSDQERNRFRSTAGSPRSAIV